jgi:hypothetical protein
MYSFLVLGLIPGTNIQITFQTWRNAIVVVLCIVAIAQLRRLRRQPVREIIESDQQD